MKESEIKTIVARGMDQQYVDLMVAVHKGDVAGLKKLLTSDVNLEKIYTSGTSLLADAARVGNKKIVEELILKLSEDLYEPVLEILKRKQRPEIGAHRRLAKKRPEWTNTKAEPVEDSQDKEIIQTPKNGPNTK